ncbi:hypothetical protein Q4485_05525 [Granulosicoccaceae sp. 1_MG-2023]|nr:hypothetical protein [Granulosicoccaceae sp. 1_MG-2023]
MTNKKRPPLTLDDLSIDPRLQDAILWGEPAALIEGFRQRDPKLISDDFALNFLCDLASKAPCRGTAQGPARKGPKPPRSLIVRDQWIRILWQQQCGYYNLAELNGKTIRTAAIADYSDSGPGPTKVELIGIELTTVLDFPDRTEKGELIDYAPKVREVIKKARNALSKEAKARYDRIKEIAIREEKRGERFQTAQRLIDAEQAKRQ